MGNCCKKKSSGHGHEIHELKTDQEFEEALNTDKIVVIDCFAEWCGPCKTVAPQLPKIAEEYSKNILFYKLDVDKNTETSGKLEISSMPTFVLFLGGEEVNRVVGADLGKLRERIEHTINISDFVHVSESRKVSNPGGSKGQVAHLPKTTTSHVLVAN